MASGECATLQEEEVEVLKAIYEGDSGFMAMSATDFRYKAGDSSCDAGGKSAVLLSIKWPEDYPDVLPIVSVDAFFNRHILPEVKSNIVEKILAEGEQYLGMSMTYTLIEYLKENLNAVMEGQPEGELEDIAVASDRLGRTTISEDAANRKPEKKQQLTKAQKKRMWDKGGLDTDDRPRGWDWTDVIRHLSQTGSKEG